MKNIILFILISATSILNAQNQYTYIVAADGSGDFTSIQKAIDATKAYPPETKTIFVRNGTYNEKVKVYNWNCKLTIVGESKEHTIITYADSFKKIDRGRNSTFHTETVLIQGNDVCLKNLTIINSSGAVGQAIALGIEADRTVIENVAVIGNQDALYTAGENCRQYFKNCYIEGTTDFIFGEATALFKNCTIHSKSNSYITAASTPKETEFGYVFIDCKLTANENVDKVYLGRPWRDYAKTVFISCELDSHIRPEGWNPWNKSGREKTAYYAEYNNYGDGAKIEERVAWSHQLSKKEAKKYTVENILNARASKINTDWMK